MHIFDAMRKCGPSNSSWVSKSAQSSLFPQFPFIRVSSTELAINPCWGFPLPMRLLYWINEYRTIEILKRINWLFSRTIPFTACLPCIAQLLLWASVNPSNIWTIRRTSFVCGSPHLNTPKMNIWPRTPRQGWKSQKISHSPPGQSWIISSSHKTTQEHSINVRRNLFSTTFSRTSQM